MKQEIIGLEQLSKKYNDKWIVKELDYSFESGISTAFVGHNGCGKSTLLKIIAGLVEPTEGKVRRNSKLTFAYVPEKFMPVPLSARNYLRSMGKLDGLKRIEADRRIGQLANDFFVEEMLDVPLKSMSKGTLQKIGVIQALLIKRDILLLDEPLSGQDEASQGVFVSKINKLREMNVTIFMSCHEQWLVDALSDQTFTIQNTKLVSVSSANPKKYVIYIELASQKSIQITKYNCPMQKYGQGYVCLIDEEYSQELIMNFLKEGFIIRGMYDENSKFAKISATDIL